MMSVYYVDGEYVDSGEATVPASDLALLRGYGIFDFLRTYGGKPFQLGAHLRRLIRSAALLDMRFPWDIEELGEIVIETLRRNGYRRIQYPPGGHRWRQPQRFYARWRIALAGDGDVRETIPVQRLRTRRGGGHGRDAAPHARNQIDQLYPGHNGTKTWRCASTPTSIEAIYRVNGKIVEGTRSNTFIFNDGAWITPADDLLLGITRAEVIKLIEADGPLDMRDISLAEYLAADEVIITSSTKEIIPVVKVDDVMIGAGSSRR